MDASEMIAAAQELGRWVQEGSDALEAQRQREIESLYSAYCLLVNTTREQWQIKHTSVSKELFVQGLRDLRRVMYEKPHLEIHEILKSKGPDPAFIRKLLKHFSQT